MVLDVLDENDEIGPCIENRRTAPVWRSKATCSVTQSFHHDVLAIKCLNASDACFIRLGRRTLAVLGTSHLRLAFRSPE